MQPHRLFFKKLTVWEIPTAFHFKKECVQRLLRYLQVGKKDNSPSLKIHIFNQNYANWSENYINYDAVLEMK